MGTDGYAFNVDPDGDPAAFMVEGLSGDWKSCDIHRSEPNCAVAPSAGAWSRRLVVRRTLAGDRNSQSLSHTVRGAGSVYQWPSYTTSDG